MFANNEHINITANPTLTPRKRPQKWAKTQKIGGLRGISPASAQIPHPDSDHF